MSCFTSVLSEELFMSKTGNVALLLLALYLGIQARIEHCTEKDEHCTEKDTSTAFWVYEYWYLWILRFRFYLQAGKNSEPKY